MTRADADGRARQVAARVLAELRQGTPPRDIAREAGMGLRTLRHYLTRHHHDDLAWALQRCARPGHRAGARR